MSLRLDHLGSPERKNYVFAEMFGGEEGFGQRSRVKDRKNKLKQSQNTPPNSRRNSSSQAPFASQ